MTDTPAPAAPATLAERARAAAAHRTDTDDPIWQNPRWLARAQQAAGRLAFILGVLPDRIQIEPSPVRRYGGWPWPELTLHDTGQRFRFVAAYCDPNQITALELCLADLGDLITGDTEDDPVDAYHQDPGHKPDCLHAAPAPRTTTGRRARNRQHPNHLPEAPMPTAPRYYTDTVVSILTDNLGPDALTELARSRSHLNPAPDPIRAALAERLHTGAREASRLEGDLRVHMRHLQEFLARAQDDLALARTPSRWEVIGTSGTAIDQAVARLGDALSCLNADAYLYAEISKHLPAPPAPAAARPEPDAAR